MKAFLSKMAAAVTMGQQQPPSSQASATSRQASDPVLQPTTPAVHQQALAASNLAMLQHPLPPLREVMLLTPVMQTREHLAQVHEPVKYSYRHGSQLVQLPPLPATADSTPGLIIDMPLEGIEHYI